MKEQKTSRVYGTAKITIIEKKKTYNLSVKYEKIIHWTKLEEHEQAFTSVDKILETDNPELLKKYRSEILGNIESGINTLLPPNYFDELEINPDITIDKSKSNRKLKLTKEEFNREGFTKKGLERIEKEVEKSPTYKEFVKEHGNGMSDIGWGLLGRKKK